MRCTDVILSAEVRKEGLNRDTGLEPGETQRQNVSPVPIHLLCPDPTRLTVALFSCQLCFILYYSDLYYIRYSQKVVTPFHISMAALEPGSAGEEDVGNGYVTVWLGIKGKLVWLT